MVAEIGTVDQWAVKEKISRQAAYQRIRLHNIPVTNGKINFAIADRIWQESMNPIKQRGGAASAAAAAAGGSDPQPSLFDGLSDDERGEPAVPMNPRERQTLAQVQLYRERWRAQRERLEVQRLLGEVVPVDQVTNFYGEMFSRLQEEFSAIGAELMDDLARETDPVRCRQMVETRVNKALTGLSKWKPE